ncbi:MAG: ABC transporter ATP-binding protein/permease [Acholeplasmatales bacterium]|nr:ABC transporter ATP-binding protein/permease [Acholeplasmatales bacterium]
MLKLKSIKKEYYVADTTVHALKGISLNFRKNEFVSILGPSGCGKTTLLNIVGGLDKYTSGDLVINGRSTKEFKDRDWDVYRNHRIGFIFQSYNLIPHQTILGNVELALTISGISKAERVERAKKALDKVGLEGQYNKKPNQLSGGQCQRVAIARALVNEPEILLADEPTGALDTVTSIQIMDLIKEIAQERLVIMVTHNPELAEKYSTRIVKLLDGEVLEDSNPFSDEDESSEITELIMEEKANDEKMLAEIDPNDTKAIRAYNKNKNAKEKAKMSMWTAFKLSAKNLYSKLKRTILVVIAGSIGIIGVSAVLSVSTGVHDYIDNMQDDMLSGNPIQITKTAVDYNTLLNSSSLSQKKDALDSGNWVNINSIIDYLVTHESALKELVYNNEFNMDYINYLKSMPKEYYQEIKMNYGIDATTNIYTDFNVFKNSEDSLKLHSDADKELANKYSRRLSLNAITETYTAMLEATPYSQYSSYITSLATVMNQGVSNTEYISNQYDVLYGDVNNFGKKNPHGVVVVLSKNKELSDLLLAQLGYFTEDEFYNMIFKAAPNDLPGEYHEELNRTKYSYEEISNKKFYWYPNDTIYEDQSMQFGDTFAHIYPYDVEAKDSWNDGVELSIAAIVRPKDSVSYGALQSGFIYSEEFAREMISKNVDSAIAKNIKEHGNVSSVEYAVGNLKLSIGINYNLKYTYYDTQEKVYKEGTKKIYVGKNQSGIMSTFMSYIGQGSGMSGISGGSGSSSEGSGITDMLSKLKTMDINGVAGTYIPESVSIYPNDFESKYLVTDYLDAWNKEDTTLTFNVYNNDFSEITGTKTLKYDERNKIKYTDSVEIIINLINTMINIITYALIAFTALALVVSTVMIAIITYVSVVERVKEIGVIRSLGGRKKDVSHLFNAETFVIGLSSGIFGVLVTGVISLLANLVVSLASDGAVKSIAHLTWANIGIMIALSIFLTLIAGLIPARSAAKKDPVVALRTE